MKDLQSAFNDKNGNLLKYILMFIVVTGATLVYNTVRYIFM